MVERDRITAMLAEMHHRGPDGEGIWCDGEVGLGMRRLAIVDIAGGDQPLQNEDHSIKVVFNGEIYNHQELRHSLGEQGHRFASQTDGAVIPHLYEAHGPGFVSRLNGIFAFALWDSQKQLLMLARDQLGVKPLYVHVEGDRVRFASELKALIKAGPLSLELDVRTLDEYLTFRFCPAPHTLIVGVEKLEPATYVLVRGGVVSKTRYWDPEPVERRDLSLTDAADQFRSLLRQAVSRQMMSDRPIGAMLSGGIDSAAIVGMMAEESTRVKTFTVGFEGGGDSDERSLARGTARLFDTDHHDIMVSLGDFSGAMTETVEALEEPVGTTSAIGFREVCRLARPLVPVLLSGQGADELLAGYWRYVGEWIAARTLGVVDRLGLGRPLGAAARRVKSPRLERGLRALRYQDTLTRFLNIYAVFSGPLKAQLYGPALTRRLEPHVGEPEWHVERHRRRVSHRDSLGQMLYVDTRLWLPDDLLLVGDKMSMAESVEMRVPFLDKDLVEFAESLPSDYKLRRGTRKVVEKRAMAGLLPDSIVNRKERGFQTPVDQWLRSGLYESAREVLLDPTGTCGTLMNKRFVAGMLEDHRDGRANHTRQIYCLYSFELWARRFLTATS